MSRITSPDVNGAAASDCATAPSLLRRSLKGPEGVLPPSCGVAATASRRALRSPLAAAQGRCITTIFVSVISSIA